MASDRAQALADRLFGTFLAPLVLGGPMVPGRPFGGKAALAFGEDRFPADNDALSRCGLLRVRLARRIAPIDQLALGPSGAEWALAAVLHDVVQSAHPGFDAVFRRSAPGRILSVAEATLDRIPPPRDVGEALSRHTWFARMLDLSRTDVDLRWWTGSQTFLGTSPPARLTAWPEVRRVHETRTPRPLMDLPTSGAAVDPSRYEMVVRTILSKSPLTDLATMQRDAPSFRWTHANLAIASTRGGRTLMLRALEAQPASRVDAALGRATRELFAARATRALALAIDVLRDRVLKAALARVGDPDREPLARPDVGQAVSDATFAVSAGALAATQWITHAPSGLSAGEREELLRLLAPAARSEATSEIRAFFGA